MRSTLFCYFTQRKLIVCYRRFGTTYRSYLEGSRSLLGLLDRWGWDKWGFTKSRWQTTSLRWV